MTLSRSGWKEADLRWVGMMEKDEQTRACRQDKFIPLTPTGSDLRSGDSPPEAGMISIRIQNLTKRFGTTTALAGLDLEVRPGELFFLLGPSGCGKTTLLRTLAGFHKPDRGRVFFDSEDVTDLEPHKRNTGMMFQSYALWPHLTVAENVAFGLEERRVPRPEIRRRVAEALDSVRMGPQAGRKPNELSGGQQQRVALARCLVIRPRCLLLDEPLSNLDAGLRLEMRSEIRRVCRQFQLTAVYVTHDQKEALAIADRMAILEAGAIRQVGTPEEVYRRPSSRRVAAFVGETNFIPGRVVSSRAGRATVETAIGLFEGVLGDGGSEPAAGAAATLSIRPECWRIGAADPGRNRVRGRIGDAAYLGELAQVDFATGDAVLKIYELNPRLAGRTGADGLYAGVDPDDVVVLLD
jgi:iron(III) transport system ATP-binding protein